MTRMSTSIITNLATWCCISQNIVQYVIHAYEIHSAVLQRLWSCDHTALFLCERTSRPPHWKCVKKSKVRLRQSMRIYLKNNPDKCYPNSIWNDWDLGFFKEHRPTRTRRITRWVAIWDQFLIQKSYLRYLRKCPFEVREIEKQTCNKSTASPSKSKSKSSRNVSGIAYYKFV